MSFYELLEPQNLILREVKMNKQKKSYFKKLGEEIIGKRDLLTGKEKKEIKPNVKDICKGWGIGLIIAGIIPFLFPDTLSTSFGIFAILLGVIALVFRAKWVMALIGAVIILVGAYNIIITLIIEVEGVFLVLGIIQILIGIGALNEYHKL